MANQPVENKSGQENRLPAYMTMPQKNNFAEAEETTSWMAGSLHRLMVWVSLGWFGIVLIYITQFFGWSNLFLMMPDEFGGFLAGVTLPLAVIWVVIAYIDRGTNFKQEARLLRTYMNNLVYPSDASGAETAQAMAEAIRAQVQELHEVTRHATEQTEFIKNELGNRVDDFAKLVGALDNYSSNTLIELNENVKNLVKSFDYVSDKAASSSDNLKLQASEFLSVQNQFQNNIGELFNSLAPRLQELQNSGLLLKSISDEAGSRMAKANELMLEFNDRAAKNVSYITDAVSAQAGKLDAVAQSAAAGTERTYQLIEKGVNRLEEVLRRQSDIADQNSQQLDKNVEQLSQKIRAQGEDLGMEVEKIIARTNAISETINTQVEGLHNVSDNISGDLEEVDTRLNMQVSRLQDLRNSSVASLDDMVRSLDDKNTRFMEAVDASIAKTNEALAGLELHKENIRRISEEAETSVKGVDAVMVEKANNLRQTAEQACAKLTETGEVMQKFAAGITEASSIVETQSRVSEASLSQQQRYITSSVTKLEEIKSELKRQVDELLKTAGTIDENASASVIRLKEQMAEALHVCENVISKTQGLNDNLQLQRETLDVATTQTLSKASQFEDIIKTQVAGLDKVSQSLEERADGISDTLDRHIAALDKSTAASLEAVGDVVTSFDKQNTILKSITESTVNHVAGVVQVLDEKAEAINILFKNQEDAFFDVCDKISENTNNIGTSLKKQVGIIEQSSDRVFSRMAILEENFGKQVDSIMQNSDKSIDKLTEIDKMFSNQKQQIQDNMTAICNQITEISQSFHSNVEDFTTVVKDVSKEAGNTTESIMKNCSQIKEAEISLVENAKNASAALENHSKALEENIGKVRSQSELIKNSLDHQKDSLTDIANVVSTQARLGESSIAQQYKMLSDVSVEVAKRMNDINAQFKENVDIVAENTSKIAYEFDVLSDKIISAGEDVTKTTKLSLKSLEQANMILTQTSDDMNACVNKSVAQIGNSAKEYEKYIAGFNTVTAEASTGVVEINNLIAEQSNKMMNISGDTKKLVDCFNTVLNDTSLELSKRANEAFDKVKGLGKNLKDLSLQVGETAKMSSIHMENASDKIRATISEVASNAERISNEIRSSGEVFLQQSNVLVAVSEETVKKMQTTMEGLTSAAHSFDDKTGNIVQRSEKFSEMFQTQLKTLLETSEKAESKLESMKKTYQTITVDTFLKDAAFMIEKLQTMAVDINRLFNPNVEEDLWKKFYNGDTGVFARYLSKTMSKQQISAIRGEYESDADFRTLVTRYLNDFEGLIAQAKNNERSGLLLSVFSGSDVGKLYFILAKAMDRVN